MILISHRGNTSGSNVFDENKPLYIQKALDDGYHVEIDVWNINNSWFLGHDNPDYETSIEFLSTPKLLVHAKNLEALKKLISYKQIHSFWHQEDNYTISTKGIIISYPGQAVGEKVICMKPELLSLDTLKGCYGICSDYISRYTTSIKPNKTGFTEVH